MTFQAIGNQRSNMNGKTIDFKKLEQDFMPGFQKEKEYYKKAIITGGRDSITGKNLPDTTLVKDPSPGELAYYRWLERVTDDNMRWNPAKDEKGNEVKGTGARQIVDHIIRVKTVKGEFLITASRLQGYDHLGNMTGVSCSTPEKHMKRIFNFTRMIDNNTGRVITQCLGVSSEEEVYDMPFNEKNVRKLVKLRAGDNITFNVKNLVSNKASGNTVLVPSQDSIEQTIKFFMQPFDYLFNEQYLSKEQKSYNLLVSKYANSGKVRGMEEAKVMANAELEEGSSLPPKQDKKMGVA